MTKLTRYLKPFLAMLAAAVLLLCGQAILDLNLPNMMSNIVNIGIQRSGIEEVAPQAVGQDAYNFLLRFMSEDDRAAAEAAYTPYEELTEAQRADMDKTFPDAGDAGAMVYTGSSKQQAGADTAFARAGYAFTEALQLLAEQQGQQISDSDEVSADFDMEQLQQLLPALAQMPPEQLQTLIDQAADAPEMMTDGVAAVLNKAFYSQLGADTDQMQTNYIIRTGLVMLLLSLANAVCAVGAGYCFAKIGAGVARNLRKDLYSKVTGFTNAELDQFSTSSLITRTTNDVNQVQIMYTMGMRMLVFAPIMGAGGIVMALRKSANISWVIAVAVLVIMGVIAVMFALVMPKFKKMQKLIDRLSMVARENLTGIMVIRAFGTQKFQEDRFDKANKDLTGNSLFVGRSMALLMPVMMLVMNALTLFIVWLGADQIAQSTMQVGDMMAYIQYAMQIIMSFLFIAMIAILIPRASVSAERINEVLRSESIVLDPEQPKTLGHRASGEVAFHNVSFRYESAEEEVLCDIDFVAKPGQTTAFIGPTGSGKSTLVNLIPRFYDVSGGSITLDGVDIRSLTQHELRDNIGYVPQKGLLFSGDIADNLRYGDEQASDQALRQAAEVAQATEFIDTMEDGFQSPISQGGTNVSGGQRQRLSIARALVKKAPVYIFDDSFSALDFATDAKLRAALGPYTEGATVLIVAQRVSTIMHAQQIVVLDAGKIVGMGTHKDLLKNCATYREIAESQLSTEELA